MRPFSIPIFAAMLLIGLNSCGTGKGNADAGIGELSPMSSPSASQTVQRATEAGCYSWGEATATAAVAIASLPNRPLFSTQCERPHHLQVFAVIDVPRSSAEESPRPTDAGSRCGRAYGAFIGKKPPKGVVSPDQQAAIPYLHWMIPDNDAEARSQPRRLICSFFQADPQISVMQSWTGVVQRAAVVPGANELYNFGPDVSASDRAQIQEWTAYGVLLQEIMFERPIKEFTTIASRDLRWLAREDCKVRPAGMPDCIGQATMIYSDVWAMGGCFPAPVKVACFDVASLANFRWDDRSNNLKTFAHEVHHVYQQQLVPNFWRSTMVAPNTVRASGPIWLWEGAAEWVGWRIAMDLETTNYATKRAEWEQIARQINQPLNKFETVAASDSVVNAYQFYVLALDELLTLAPAGASSLSSFYEEINAGTQWKTAFKRAFGLSVEEFYGHFETVRPH